MKELNVCESKILKWIRKGYISPQQNYHQYFFREKDIEALKVYLSLSQSEKIAFNKEHKRKLSLLYREEREEINNGNN